MSFDDIKQREDETGIVKSQTYLHGLIAAEIEKGIPSERIVLGGFSQGGAMSIFSGVTCPTKLGGIFGLSCYLLLQGKVKDMVPKENPNKVCSTLQILILRTRLIPAFVGNQNLHGSWRCRPSSQIRMGPEDRRQAQRMGLERGFQHIRGIAAFSRP